MISPGLRKSYRSHHPPIVSEDADYERNIVVSVVTSSRVNGDVMGTRACIWLLLSTHGTYFEGEWSTDEQLAAGAYAAGARVQSSFMLGVLSEGMDHAYRVTGNAELRRRMLRMAEFVDRHGLDPDYRYTASLFGIVDGETWHSYSAEAPVEFWDPVYTTSLVNVLMRGYRYSCERQYFERAALFFARGNGAIYGQPTMRSAPDGEVHHFVDTRFDSSAGNFYLDYNKGELQYTYLLFAR